MNWFCWRGLFSVTLALFAATGCSGDDAPNSDEFGNGGGESPVGTTAGATGSGATNGGPTPGGGLPPEQEVELSFERPAVGRSRVYALNPASDRVAVVNADTFSIQSIEVGDQPDYAVTVPDRDVAVVLNTGSSSVSILRSDKGSTTSLEVPIAIEANRLAMAPNGEYVLAYFDSRAGTGQATSFQDVVVVALSEGKELAARVTVGFRPSRIQFSDDGTTAFVVNEDGISVIGLVEAAESDGSIARLVGVGDAVTDPISTDISVTGDGRYALARRDGSTELRLIDLATEEILTLDVAQLSLADGPAEGDAGADAGDGGTGSDAGPTDAGPTDAGPTDASTDGAMDGAVTDAAGPPSGPTPVLSDADLSADGSFVLAVLRSHGTLLKLSIPEAFEDPSLALSIILDDAPTVGSAVLSSDGTLAVTYTTADPSVESVTLVELSEPFTQSSVRLRKAVRAVALSDDASRLLVLHQARTGEQAPGASDEDDRIDRAQGYSVVDVPNLFAKLQLTEAVVSSQGGFAITPDARHLFVMIRNDDMQVRQLQQVDLSNLAVRTTLLAAPPTSLGLVADVGRAFVGQELSGGMLTFVNWDNGGVQTVTGFELSSRIRP